MRKLLKKSSLLLSMALLLATLFSFTLFAGTSFASTASSTWAGRTTGWANARTGTNTGTRLVKTIAPNTRVTVYATVSGQVVWGGIRNWYRISSLSSSPLYIYGGLVAHITTTGGGGAPPTISAQGRVIIVNRTHQWLYAYLNGKLVKNMPVTTGRPTLQTPLGTYHVFRRLSPTTFYSPWPQGSPYWYPPTHINYAMEFDGRGIFLHDATWRGLFGPGTNTWHFDPKMGWTVGTHGCVNMTLSNAAWLYQWVPIGTTVKVVD